MKYIIKVLMVIPFCYTFSYATSITEHELNLSSGSISSTVNPALEEENCSNGSIYLDIENNNGPFHIEWSNGSNAIELEELSPGEYCVTVTDELCGEATGCWEVKCCPFLLHEDQINLSVLNPACQGQKGELQLFLYNIPEDAYPLTLFLENSSDNSKYDQKILSDFSTIIKLSEGNYNAHLFYGGGCFNTFEFKIQFKPIEVELEKTEACAEDGTIDVIVKNGKNPYTYSWSDDPDNTDSYRSGLSSGQYTVYVKDANNCMQEASVYIKKSDPILLKTMSAFIGPSDCFTANGVIEISKEPLGGTPPFSYQWSNGKNGKVIKDLEGGDYFLTIYDDLGCSATTSFNVPAKGQPVITSSVVTHTCPGQNFGEIGVLASSTVGGTLQYEWSNGLEDFIIDSLVSGIYTVTITDDKNQCTLVETFEVEEEELEPLEVTKVVEHICESESGSSGKISLNIKGGAKPYVVNWSNGESGLSIDNLPIGEYSAIITDKCGNTEEITQSITSVQLEVAIESHFPNFEEVLLEAKVTGGTSPYSYSWNTGEETFFKVDENEGLHSVTVTDQNGCNKSEEIDVVCDPVNFAIITTGSCVSTFKLKIGPNNEIGPGPFLVKIEKKVNQQYTVVDYRLFATTQELLNYEFVDPDLGTFRVSVTNYCGFNKTEIFNSCIDCDYHFYNVNEDYFVDIMGGLFDFELVCPCSNDCGFLGFTTDKVKLLLNQAELEEFSDEISGFPTFKINWPEGESIIFHSANSGKFEVNGPKEYVLSNPDFDNGINISVSATLPFGIGEVCNLNIPIEFGKEGINGFFKKWDNPGLDPFVNHDPPYNWGTVACSNECTIPLVDGVLYENEPIDSDEEADYYNQCTEDFSETQIFFYEPNNYNQPCKGGGSLFTHYESVIGVVIGQKTLPPNVAIDAHPFWSSQMLEENDVTFPYTCPPHTVEKGYCLFDSKDVYGEDVVLRDPIIASYCKGREFDPPIDTDGDGLPDVVDPCPLNPDVLCLEDDNNGDPLGGGNVGGGVDENGCQTTFLPEDCKLAIICPDEEPTYVDGVVTSESYSGTQPCVHCFTVDVCRVIDPNTGVEYAEVVGPISGWVDVSLGDIPECGNVCAILFHCTSSGEFLGYLCAADCQTTNNPLCQPNQLDDVISKLVAEDGPSSIQIEMTEEIADEIIGYNTKSATNSMKKRTLTTVPNPSNSEFIVQYESSYTFETLLEIRNIHSELVYSETVPIQKGSNEIKINRDLLAGVYLITIQEKESIVTIKHIVQN